MCIGYNIAQMPKNRSIAFCAIQELIHEQNMQAQLNRRFVKDELQELFKKNKQKFECCEVKFAIFT